MTAMQALAASLDRLDAATSPAAKGLVSDALADVQEYLAYLGRQIAGPDDTTRATEIAVRLRAIEDRLAAIEAAADPSLDGEAQDLAAEAEQLQAEYDAIGYDKATKADDDIGDLPSVAAALGRIIDADDPDSALAAEGMTADDVARIKETLESMPEDEPGRGEALDLASLLYAFLMGDSAAARAA